MFFGDNFLQEPRRALTFVPTNSSWVSKSLLCPAFHSGLGEHGKGRASDLNGSCSSRIDSSRHVRFGIFRNKNVFRNIFRLFCSWEQNSQNGIQVFRNEISAQTNAYLHYSNYSYSGLIPNERAPRFVQFRHKGKFDRWIDHHVFKRRSKNGSK